MGFGQALSGLNAAAQNLDVIGNNIANSSTAGFKSGTATFADVYASSRIGLGVQVSGVNQRFTTGNLETTGNQYDLAIDGANGFFRLVTTNGEVQFSRNGQFTKDKTNYIVNAQGLHLTGYPADVRNPDGSLVSGVGQDPVALRVPQENIAPQATTKVDMVRNLDAGSPAIDPVTTPFNPSSPTSFSNSVPMTVYDSLGNAHTLTQYFVKREANAAGESRWDTYFTLDGKAMEPTVLTTAPALNGVDLTTLSLVAGERLVSYVNNAGDVAYAVVDATGAAEEVIMPAPPAAAIPTRSGTPLADTNLTAALESGRIITPGNNAEAQVYTGARARTFDTSGRLSGAMVETLSIANPGGTTTPAAPLTFTIDYTGTTQFGTPFTTNFIQDGYASGEFASISVGKDGRVMASYTNGETQNIGTVVLASFNNANGLQSVGGNAWVESAGSGQAILGQPGTNGLATIMGQAIESSNVDMSQELVNMIIAQRTYQANAQTIKTQDQVMQTLMQMR